MKLGKWFALVALAVVLIVAFPAVALAAEGGSPPTDQAIALLTSAAVIVAITEAIKRASGGRIADVWTVAVAVAVGLTLNLFVYFFAGAPWFAAFTKGILDPLAAVGGITAISKFATTVRVPEAPVDEVTIYPDEA